jgi:methylated-DNA-[protein]-cysteine S-methyltransferase
VTPSSEASAHRVDTPLGPLWLGGDEDGLTEVAFHGEPDARSGDALLQEAAEQLRAYFAGELRRFELPLSAQGTEFQRRVWDAVAGIPYGTTSTYGRTATYSEVAAAVGRPSACRAVGAANGRNPLPIVVPCHRLVGASGALTGYGGGLALKRALLDLEAAAS